MGLTSTATTGVLLSFFLSITLLVSVIKSGILSAQRSSSHLVGFQRSESTRSTMDIVYFCLSTMVISSMSAIHPNIPAKNRWVKWCFSGVGWTIGVLVPEIMVYNACVQYQEALIDFTSVRNMPLACVKDWTLKHSFFAKMEGFRVDAGDIVTNGRELVNIRRKADWKRIGRDIADKSKKDVLSKCVAVIQIGRFLVTMIARAAISIPISPLEYFTCVQVVCALLMYAFWFEKPYNVQECIHIPASRKDKVVGPRHEPSLRGDGNNKRES